MRKLAGGNRDAERAGLGVTDSARLWATGVSEPSEGLEGPEGPGEDRVNTLPRRPFNFLPFSTWVRKPTGGSRDAERAGLGVTDALLRRRGGDLAIFGGVVSFSSLSSLSIAAGPNLGKTFPGPTRPVSL